MVLETNHARLYTVTLELARAGKQRVDGGLASSDSAAAAKVERERSPKPRASSAAAGRRARRGLEVTELHEVS
tara:strand:- start:223 stop:441 length:219 start_codon:yes stop_codon:yes gene_type:complete